MILKDIPEGAYGELDIAYAYDLIGRPVSVASAGTHVVSYVYDGFGRTLSETGPMGTKYMAWDAAGRMTRLTWPDGFTIGYSYFDNGAMHEVREAPDGANLLLATFGYDDLGRRSALTRGNGTVTTYTYDALDRLASLAHDLAGTGNDVGWTFAYDPAGGLRALIRDNDSYAWTGHYAVNRAYTSNGLNQYSAAGPASFAYDARGNLAYDGLRGYAYTSENRLAYTGTGPESSALFYDPLGRLHQLYHYDGATEHLTRFDNLGDRIVSETYLNAGTLRRYVPGPDPDEVLVWYEGSGTGDRRYLHADEHGSTVAISDGNGAALAINRYDEYGIPAVTNTGRFQYTGQTWLAEIGLYHYKARVYSPTWGRFLQTDPIGYEDQFNLYAYVGNDPVNRTDPDGQAGLALSLCVSPAAPLCAGIGPIIGGFAVAEGLVLHIVGPPNDPANPPTLAGDIPASDRTVSRNHNREPEEPRRRVAAPTDHGQERRDQARTGDPHRQVGDPNRVIREGRAFTDNQTGNTVYVGGNRAVVVNPQGQQVTQFRITSQNVQKRIRDERWRPR